MSRWVSLPTNQLSRGPASATFAPSPYAARRFQFGAAAEAGHAKLSAQTRESILGDHRALLYAEVGRRLGMNESAVATTVHRLRVCYRKLFREEIAHAVGSIGKTDAGVPHLFQVLGG